MPPTPIPPFLLPRGLPSARALHVLQHQHRSGSNTRIHVGVRYFSATRPAAKAKKSDKLRVLSQPDKFRPPSHPQRIVNSARTSPSGQPINYGPRLTTEQREMQNKKQYPNMFPPEGTVMYKFLTSRWIHIWIAMVSEPLHGISYLESCFYHPVFSAMLSSKLCQFSPSVNSPY